MSKTSKIHNKEREFILGRVKKIMKERGWNKKQFAIATETPLSTLYDFIQGIKVSTPSIFTIFHLCEKMGWPYAYFFLEDELMLIPKKKLEEMDERMKNTRVGKFMRYYNYWFLLSPKKQDAVLHLLEEFVEPGNRDVNDKGKQGKHDRETL